MLHAAVCLQFLLVTPQMARPENSDKIFLQQSHKDQFWEIIRKKIGLWEKLREYHFRAWWGREQNWVVKPSILKLCCKNFLFVFWKPYSSIDWELRERYIYWGGKTKKLWYLGNSISKENQEKKKIRITDYSSLSNWGCSVAKNR